MIRNQEKTELFGQHFARVFQPHDSQSDIEPTPIKSQGNESDNSNKKAQNVGNNAAFKKTAGIDEISHGKQHKMASLDFSIRRLLSFQLNFDRFEVEKRL